ncbi:MAG: acyl-CoA dehydrogenase family protein [Deltaproteobacteria bacterium]|nr:acyl-CoA dehydrogenase family protein [Deltaproteobacteria bacterium]
MAVLLRKTETKGKTEALEVVESARETVWAAPSFVADLFLGQFRSALLFPYPEQDPEDRCIGDAFCAKVAAFLKANLDADEVDRTGDLPKSVIDGLVQLGCFGMKIPKEYGGLGFSQTNYDRAIALIASHCASTAVWLSAHQSIGVPQPLKLFGTPEQKQKYLPKLAAGAISAFALTEPDVGSDPAKMTTMATPVDNGAAYLLNGEKLWCTNGPVADYLVVVARTPSIVEHGREKKQLTAFIVEKTMPGFEIVRRCDFMGIRGIQNALIRLTNVRVPKENVLWGPGLGLKLALTTLNTGRLTLPASCIGGAKRCLEICRRWANERVQWGQPIGRHEAIGVRLARMAANTFAMEAVTWYACALVDRGGADIRLEAAMAKMFSSEALWELVNDAMQIKGGRGYETAQSLKARGESPDPIERIMRDSRINTIFEGSSEIMRLFIAREALDPHLKVAGELFNPKAPLAVRLQSAWRMLKFYARWYPRQWFYNPRARTPGVPWALRGHLRFVRRASHRLARAIVHAMGRYGPGLERRQMVLWRAVDIGTDLFAMSAAVSRSARMLSRHPGDSTPQMLADHFCREARRRIRANFRQFFSATDRRAVKAASRFLDGDMAWLEEGIVR